MRPLQRPQADAGGVSSVLSLCPWSLVLLRRGCICTAAHTMLLLAMGAGGEGMGALSWKHLGSKKEVDSHRGSLGN